MRLQEKIVKMVESGFKQFKISVYFGPERTQRELGIFVCIICFSNRVYIYIHLIAETL